MASSIACPLCPVKVATPMGMVKHFLDVHVEPEQDQEFLLWRQPAASQAFEIVEAKSEAAFEDNNADDPLEADKATTTGTEGHLMAKKHTNVSIETVNKDSQGVVEAQEAIAEEAPKTEEAFEALAAPGDATFKEVIKAPVSKEARANSLSITPIPRKKTPFPRPNQRSSFSLQKDKDNRPRVVPNHKTRCETCHVTLHTVRELKRHCLSAHNIRNPYSCSFCTKSYSRPTTLSMHIESVHLLLHEYPCKFCDQTLASPQNVRRHMVFTHPEEYKKMENKM